MAENKAIGLHHPGVNSDICHDLSHKFLQESVFRPDFHLKRVGGKKILYNQMYITQYSSIPGPLKLL